MILVINGVTGASTELSYLCGSRDEGKNRAFLGRELRRRPFAKSTVWIILKLVGSKSACHRVELRLLQENPSRRSKNNRILFKKNDLENLLY